MTRKWTGAILAVVILAVAAPLAVLALLHALEGETQAAPAANGQQLSLKWEQIPDKTSTGVDVYAGNNGGLPPFVLADDFQCTETGPITQIMFWGSWYNDILPQVPLSFTLSIHSDIPDPDPQNPDDFSQPGGVLWSHTYEVGPGGCVANLEQEGVPEGLYVPGPEIYLFPADYQVWRYTCPIPSGQQFTQQGGNIYWLDVQAVYADTSAFFGWKTSLDHWQDDGVWATGTEPPFTWSELRYPAGHDMVGQSIDLAFGIYGPPEQLSVKWEQLPDLTPPDPIPTGLDVYASWNSGAPMYPPHVLADDFLCTQTGPISQIEFWGSWFQDYVPPGVSFTLSIHSDLPGPPYSQPAPGDPLWSHTYLPGECVATPPEPPPTPEGFYVPLGAQYEPFADTQVWRYTCPGPDPEEFIQEGTPEQPVIYWLDVQALYVDSNPFAWFGWKTSLQHWHDDAVWTIGVEPVPSTWAPLTYPLGHPLYPQSMDMAFRIWGPPPTPEADLEKVDLQVRPFYCGDSDMDGMEDGSRVQAGLGNCCDNVNNDGDTSIDGRDPQCAWQTNEDPVNGVDDDSPIDNLIDEDPLVYPSGQTCPWNGDDDCDGAVDEDPKNNADDDGDGLVDEDPANGFLGIDNDRDGLVDEDGGGRFDFNGNTIIDPCVNYPGYGLFCEDQGEGVDDDGDTSVDEDPLDSPVAPDLPPVTKLVQPPDPQSGWDILATWFGDMGAGYALADDYVCNKTGSVTEIRFWGSWLGDTVPPGGPAAVSFTLSIHSDVPAGQDRPYSHPGPTMWMRPYGPGECQVIASMPAPETFRNPQGGQMGIDNMAYLYSCPLGPGEFTQQQGTIYWLNVQAHLNWADGVMFGWKTAPTVRNDSAVYAAAPKPPAILPTAWEPMTFPKDLAFEIVTQQVVPTHEPHYLVKEILVNHGPEPWVTAWDIKFIDAPYWRANALEDGLTTCNDNQDNDPWNSDGKDAADPDCRNPHIGEEAPGLHSCNDTLDNGSGIGQGDGLIDEQDPQCQTLTEVSVECENLDTNRVSIPEGVPLYVKPPSDSQLLQNNPGCAQYYTTDPARWSKCVPCKIPMGPAPPGGIAKTCREILTPVVPPPQLGPGYCIAVDSMPGVTNELAFHQDVELGYRTHNMYLYYGSPGDPIGSEWGQLHPAEERYWTLTSWEDNGDEMLSASDQIDMVDYSTGEKAWFYVDQITDLVGLYSQGSPVVYVVPIAPASVTQPIGAWTAKWYPQYFGQVCDISGWHDYGTLGEVNPGDQLLVNNCAGISQPTWLDVGDMHQDMWLSEKVVDEHQFDLACEGPTSLHRFTIGNLLEPQGVIDPIWPDNNHKETVMLVGCTSFAEASVHDLNVLLPDPPPPLPGTHWDVLVSHSESTSVSVFATNAGPAPADFVVSLEEESPGLGIAPPGGTGQLEDSDNDGWANNVENLLFSLKDNPDSRPESLHALNDTTGQPSCNDGIDNDGDGLKDAADSGCQDADGDGYTNWDEGYHGSNPADPNSTPEHMQFPWTCGDGLDNDGDGGTDSTELDGPDLGTDGDCTNAQLQAVRPPVTCASGWVPQAGDSQYVYLAGDGTLTVGLNIPLNNLLDTIPVGRTLLFHCFAPKSPYPTETVRATIRPQDVHVLDLNPDNDAVVPATFNGNATCLYESDLELASWVFDPAGAPADFHVNEEQVFQTTKTIYNHGPTTPVDILVQKTMNVPVNCDGSLKVSYDNETVNVAEGTKYNVGSGHGGPWLDGPAELHPAKNATVYVQSRSANDQTNELAAQFIVAAVAKDVPKYVAEDFDIYCRQPSEPGKDYSFLFGNQITHAPPAGYPDYCDPTLGDLAKDKTILVKVQPDADGDTVPDGMDNCPYVANGLQENHDSDKGGDACDCDDDNGGAPDRQEIRDGTNPLNPADDHLKDTNDTDNDKGLNWEEDWSDTDPFDRCGDDCSTTHTDDAWGYDINIDCWCNSSDILAFPANIRMPAELGEHVAYISTYRCRYDLNGDNWINSSDILLFPQRIAMPKQCTNP